MIEIYGYANPPPDGTGVRDYVHVNDLALGHALAVDYLEAGNKPLVVNLGSEKGLSVREIIDGARRITGKPIPERIVGRRLGDPANLVASSALAQEVLGWSANHSSLDTIIETSWRAYKENMG